MIIPTIKKINSKITARISLKLVFKRVSPSGNKSVIDSVSMTPEAKDKDAEINLLIFLNLKYIGINPNIVENPAIIVKIKGIILLDMSFTNKFY